MKLSVSRKQIDLFKLHAKAAYPKEHLEFLFGTRDAEDGLSILRIVPVKITVASNSGVQYSDCDARRVRRRMAGSGLSWLGTIHSHPDWDASPSICDADGALSSGENIMGILSVKPNLHRFSYDLRWWHPTALLPPPALLP